MIAAEPDARLVIGVDCPMRPRLKSPKRSATTGWKNCWSTPTSSAGDVLYIPAGTIHALGPGVLVYEIQQSSDTTYRLYDWGRMGLDGKPRPLHIDKGVAVSRLGQLPPIRLHRRRAKHRRSMIVESPYFKTVLHQLRGEFSRISIPKGVSSTSLTCIEGTAEITSGGTVRRLRCGTGTDGVHSGADRALPITGTAKVSTVVSDA